MIQTEIVALILTGTGIIISILYYTSVLRNANKTQKMQLETRQAQLFMDMYERWSDPEFSKHHLELNKWEWKDYDDFVEKYSSTKNPERYLSFTTIGRFFEGLGVLVKRKLIDPYLVDDLMSSDILEFWEKFEPFILERRIQTNTPQVWEYVEYLYNTIKPIVESQHPELKT